MQVNHQKPSDSGHDNGTGDEDDNCGGAREH